MLVVKTQKYSSKLNFGQYFEKLGRRKLKLDDFKMYEK